jgi:hypothetical protein
MVILRFNAWLRKKRLWSLEIVEFPIFIVAMFKAYTLFMIYKMCDFLDLDLIVDFYSYSHWIEELQQ